MSIALRLLIVALSVCMATGLRAQHTVVPVQRGTEILAGGADDPIIVTGDRFLDEDRVREAVRSIARRGRSSGEPLVRFQDPLCVMVSGLGDVLSERVAERIRLQARNVGAKLAESGCTPNATVVLVDRPKVLIDRMRRERPALLDSDSLRRIRSALDSGYPAISWASTERRDQFGRQLPPGNPLGGLVRESLFDEMLYARDNRFPSQLNLNFSTARSGAFVVFNAYEMSGVHLDQLADYATMHILGNPKPDARLSTDGPASILDLFRFGPEEAPPGLTLIDLAYLKGLYAMRPTDPGRRLESSSLVAYEELAARDDLKGHDPRE